MYHMSCYVTSYALFFKNEYLNSNVTVFGYYLLCVVG